MLRSLKQICGDKLGATDGEIGHIKDFYFDDLHWAVRYVVADTGSWISGRLVLLSPHAFKELPDSGRVVPLSLTKKKIEAAPSIDAHKPVSRQFEEEYYQYYGWPTYWQGDSIWGGMGGFPILSEPMAPFQEIADPKKLKPKGRDAHLRSVQAVLGYQIQASDSDDTAGQITDFLMDDRSWVISRLVVNVGSFFHGKKILLPVTEIERISWEDSKVFVDITKTALLEHPELGADATTPAARYRQ